MANLFRTSTSRFLLDGFERVVLVILFIWLCARFADTVAEHPSNLLFLASEAMVALMIVFRRSTDQISVRTTDWVTGFGGTLLPLLVQPASGGHSAAVGLLMLGLVVSVGAKLSLRRSFGLVAANRGVKRTGLYATVRHPMYLGYFLTYAGFLILNPSIVNAALLTGWAMLQILRIDAEERMLLRDPEYQEHARHVRFRLLPYVY